MSISAGKTLLETIATDELPDLGPGPRANVLAEPELIARVDAWLLENSMSARAAELHRAAALLWHDHHEAAHGIVQEDPGPESSCLHAILHRREPDASNAKYWFHRVGRPPSHEALGKGVAELLEGDSFTELRVQLLPGGQWSADAFVEACCACKPGEVDYSLLQRIQQLEMESLLEYIRTQG